MAFPAGGYASVVAAEADGLLHHYAMDEESSAPVADTTGTQNATCTDFVTAAIVDGKFGKGRLHYPTTGGCTAVQMHAEATEGTAENYTAWTVAAWIRPDSPGISGERGIWAFGASSWPLVTWEHRVRFDLDGRLRVALRPASSSLNVDSATGVITLDAWQHIAVTCDGSTLRVYHNGTQVASNAAGQNLNINRHFSGFGWEPVGGTMRGATDDAAIWLRALTQPELAEIYNAGTGTPIFQPVVPATITIDASLDEIGSELWLWSDWSVLIDPVTTRVFYRAELTGAADLLDDLILRISSWQATIQTGRADFLQVVVPSALDVVEAINARPGGEVVVYRGAHFADGTVLEQEMARVPLGSPVLNRGPRNATMTLSGYAYDVAHPIVGARTLTGLRSESVDSAGARVRADIDWRLRPGMQAIAGDRTLAVSYINYYVSGGQAYMDVGERSNG